jgi:diadenosine tetraphosphatase ApaH/serine/threonine PP2A family protein phosphatase
VRYAILSDIHGNFEALQAVLDDAATRTDALLCLGDVVGYGPDPERCIDAVAARAEAVVGGNHEHAVAGRLSLDWFNPYARAAAEWTSERLDDDQRGFLGGLPLVAEVADATIVHSSPAHPEEWHYLVEADDGFEAFHAFAGRLCFVGHSHRPAVWSLGSSGPEYAPGGIDVRLDSGRRYIVNVGSVGQPRDRDPRAAYVVWDVEARRIEGRRVVYDMSVTHRKIVQAGLPKFLADRLRVGA